MHVLNIIYGYTFFRHKTRVATTWFAKNSIIIITACKYKYHPIFFIVDY